MLRLLLPLLPLRLRRLPRQQLPTSLTKSVTGRFQEACEVALNIGTGLKRRVSTIPTSSEARFCAWAPPNNQGTPTSPSKFLSPHFTVCRPIRLPLLLPDSSVKAAPIAQ